MNKVMLLLAVASLSACNSKSDAPAAPVVKAALTFDGAGTTDRAALLKHGERLTHVLGCRGCHTDTLQGELFNEDTPEDGVLYASNLTRVLPTMTDAQLESLLRTGVHPTRKDLWIMPSEVFQRLSAADMAALIAHLRTVKPSGKPTPAPVLSAKFRADLASGKQKPTAAWVANYKSIVPPDLGDQHALGRYIASITCSECHGGDLTGIEDFTPNLDIAGSYTAPELTRLLTSGEGKVKKDLGLMSIVGRGHFAHFTPKERAAVVAYIKARVDRPN
ncbi:MAG: cytochrome c [Sphingomicrobium sp.]